LSFRFGILARNPLHPESPSETCTPVISLSPPFLQKPPPAASTVADASRPSASQRTGWFAAFE